MKAKKKKKVIKKKIKKAIKKKVLQKKIVKKQVVKKQIKEEHSLELRDVKKDSKVNLFGSFNKSVEATLNKQGIYWEDEPVGLREFVTSPDHMNIPLGLTEKQYEPLDFLFGLEPKKILESMNTIAVEEWAKGSFRWDTKLKDELTGEIHTLREWAKFGKKINIKYYNFDKNKESIAKILPPFSEGVGKIYKVRTKTGKVVYVNEHHKFLTKAGWKKIKDMKIGEKIATKKK